jgi:hypothetical protein
MDEIELPPLPDFDIKETIWTKYVDIPQVVHGHSDKAIQEYARLAVAAERERCLRACDQIGGNIGPGWNTYVSMTARRIAAAIRPSRP